MASKQTQKRKYKKSSGKKRQHKGKQKRKQTQKQKRKQSQKQKRKQSRKKKGGSINPLRSLFRHASFASTRLADTWAGRQTPIHYDPNVTSQFGKNVLTNGKIANIVGSNL